MNSATKYLMGSSCQYNSFGFLVLSILSSLPNPVLIIQAPADSVLWGIAGLGDLGGSGVGFRRGYAIFNLEHLNSRA